MSIAVTGLSWDALELDKGMIVDPLMEGMRRYRGWLDVKMTSA
jgi:hypothetical protein